MYIYMEYYSVIEKNQMLPFVVTWMDLDGIRLSEINQIEKDKYCDITYIWKLKNITNKQQIHRYRKQSNGHQWQGEGQHTSGGVSSTDYRGEDGFKDVWYNTGNMANIL